MGIAQSMGRLASALDNAVIESWHSTLEFDLRRPGSRTTTTIAGTRLPDAGQVAYEQLLAQGGKGDSLTMLLVFRYPASAGARPCQGPTSSAVPDGPDLRAPP